MAADSCLFFYQSSHVYSQWHPATFTIDGIEFNCTEQWMMWSKAKLFKDEVAAEQILTATSPKEQKFWGRKVKNFDETIWSQQSCQIVYLGNLAKFSQNSGMRRELFKTDGRELVEASPNDAIWGIGMNIHDAKLKIKSRSRWGRNLLGKILTLLRQTMMDDVNHRLYFETSSAEVVLPADLSAL